VLERKWTSTALADIPGSVEARADGIVDAAKGVADAAKNIATAEGALAKAKGVLATVGATFETLTAVEQLLSVPYSAIPFPALAAARIWDLAVAPPHAHLHPPNLIPPAPLVYLPSAGPILPIPYVSGAEKVLINGVPAARCGDIGLSVWCGSLVPFYEIFFGSSNVWIQGSRAARQGLDFTKHCIFSTPKPSDPPVGNPIGAIVTASHNVIIGGMPLPSFSSWAIGKAFGFIGKKIGNKVKAARAAAAARKAAAEELRAATKVFAKKCIGKGLKNRVVAAVVKDLLTGQISYGINGLRKIGKKIVEVIPKKLHPILERRFNKVALIAKHGSLVGSHAEVYALNQALWRREAYNAAHGLGKVTEKDLGGFMLDTAWLKGKPPGSKARMIQGAPAPRCRNCNKMTDGVINLAGDSGKKTS
jgi:uncharacterized Zn-binding protein involved in type VI secretion